MRCLCPGNSAHPPCGTITVTTIDHKQLMSNITLRAILLILVAIALNIPTMTTTCSPNGTGIPMSTCHNIALSLSRLKDWGAIFPWSNFFEIHVFKQNRFYGRSRPHHRVCHVRQHWLVSSFGYSEYHFT